MPAVLQKLQAKHPGLTVDLHEGAAATLEEMVVSGTVDLVFRPLLPKMRDTTLCHRTTRQENIVAAMRENDPLAGQASLRVDDVLAPSLIGNPAGSEEDGGGFDVRNTLGEAVGRAKVLGEMLTTRPAPRPRLGERHQREHAARA